MRKRPTSVEAFKLKAQVPPERYEQIRFANWLDKSGILYTASANGELRDKRTGSILKRMGVKRGFPDITLPYMRQSHGGLYIELKRVSGGTMSPYQKWWKERLEEQGYICVRANGCNEAIQITLNYLGTWTPIKPLKDKFEDDIESLPSFGGEPL